MARFLATSLLAAALIASSSSSGWAFDLQFSISDPGGLFNAAQLSILNDALIRVERMWETVITGYQPGISIAAVPISVQPTTAGLAAANFTRTTLQGGFRLATAGFININVNEIHNFASWQGIVTNPAFTGRNYIDELLAHETGHVLGVGTLWDDNGIYVNNTFQYTGQHGLAAYKAEFDPTATFVPVENAGNPGTPNAHWDQLMRSSPQEGNPSDPFSLDPRVGVTDPYGRDRALELLTGAIDPDHGEPFISRFGVEAMRDLGYTVARFEDFNSDGVVDLLDRTILLANFGATGLEVDSMAFGDANTDRVIDTIDLNLWRVAFGVPEPGGLTVAAFALLLAFSRHRALTCGGNSSNPPVPPLDGEG
jgi:hypothetical protein